MKTEEEIRDALAELDIDEEVITLSKQFLPAYAGAIPPAARSGRPIPSQKAAKNWGSRAPRLMYPPSFVS